MVTQSTSLIVREADLAEIQPLAKLWYDGWQDAHARIVPAELVRVRTLQNFQERLLIGCASVRVAGPPLAPIGFYWLRGAELYQFYVSAPLRGSGVAALLMADAEAHLYRNGVGTAWLGCAINNHRAARFYEKCGWVRKEVATELLEIPGGTFPLAEWRYEKALP
jgi:GNAT superfamily N-acetyltransferase